MFNDFLEEFIVPTVIIVGLVACFIIAPIAGVGLWFESVSCYKRGSELGKETVFHPIGAGCVVKINNEFIPYDRWIHNDGN